MAKPKKNTNGTWTITITRNYERRKLTLGMIGKTEADSFAANLNLLCDHRRQYPGIPIALRSWVELLSINHREQLGQLGIISKYDSSTTVQELIDDFLDDYDDRPEIKPETKTSFRQSMKHRFPKMLKNVKIQDLEPAIPDDRPHAKPTFSRSAEQLCVNVVSWQREHYALSSWSRANGRIREVGGWAVARGICKFNPFTLLPKPEQVNDERNQQIPTEWVLDVMANCIDPDTRLCVALGRFQGIRTPSECRRLLPSHIDFEGAELVIIGKGANRPKRRMPLFETAREELVRHREMVGWNRNVFSGRFLGCSDSNNYSLLREAVVRAGYDAWPRLRQNLRSSCENDLLEAGFSERLVTAWLGHTVKTSRKSYQKQSASDRKSSVERARSIGF